MIYNDHLYAIEDQIEQLISSIKNSQLFRSYCYNKKAMYQDQEVLGLIDSFVHKRPILKNRCLWHVCSRV